MNINTIRYWIIEAFSSMKKNMKTFAMSFFIIAATLLVIATAYMLMQNANKALSNYENIAGKIEVYLKKGLSEEQIEAIKGQIKGIDGLDGEPKYVSSKENYEIAKKMGTSYTEGIPEDFYPASVYITVTDYEKIDGVIEKLRQINGVGEESNDIVKNGQMEKQIKGAKTLKILAITLLIILAEVSILIMTNSIKLVMYARRKEVTIMKYVGATDRFIKVPFIIEGIIIALVGAFIALLISGYAYDIVAKLINSIGIMGDILGTEEIIKSLALPLCIFAIGIGTVGSSISIKKYLDV